MGEGVAIGGGGGRWGVGRDWAGWGMGKGCGMCLGGRLACTGGTTKRDLCALFVGFPEKGRTRIWRYEFRDLEPMKSGLQVKGGQNLMSTKGSPIKIRTHMVFGGWGGWIYFATFFQYVF